LIGGTIVATVVLRVPLVVIISHREKDDAFLELDRVAARTAANVPSNVNLDPDRINLPKVERAIDIAVYDRAGRRISGRGPDRADSLTATAFAVTRSSTVDDERVVAPPVTPRAPPPSPGPGTGRAEARAGGPARTPSAATGGR